MLAQGLRSHGTGFVVWTAFAGRRFTLRFPHLLRDGFCPGENQFPLASLLKAWERAYCRRAGRTHSAGCCQGLRCCTQSLTFRKQEKEGDESEEKRRAICVEVFAFKCVSIYCLWVHLPGSHFPSDAIAIESYDWSACPVTKLK